MPIPNLLVICGTALLSVFVVLTTLAGVMQVLIRLFPQASEQVNLIEPTLVSAINEGVSAAYPGTRVTGIEELR